MAERGNEQADSVSRAWIDTQRVVLSLKATGDLDRALSALEEFLVSSDLDGHTVGEVVGFRGMLDEERGDLKHASGDYLVARALSAPSSYSRYTLELSLGHTSERRGYPEEAGQWYELALRTSLSAPRTSGGTALQAFLRIRATGEFDPDEKRLCERVAEHSWVTLGLPGAADLTNLRATADLLVKNMGAGKASG